MDGRDNLRFRDELCRLKPILFPMSPWRCDYCFNHDPSTTDNCHTHYAAYHYCFSHYDRRNDCAHLCT